MRTRDPWAPPTTPFTLAQVAPLGITDKRLRSARAADAITRLRRGVYVASPAVPDDPVALHLLRALAEQVASPDWVASHDTAALALGLPLPMDSPGAAGPTHLTQAKTRTGRSLRTEGRHLHLGPLPQHHVQTLPSGLVVTSPARTALDVAGRLDLPNGLMIVDAAARCELVALAGSADRRHYGNPRLVSAATRPLVEALGHLPDPRAGKRLSTLLGLVDVRRETPLESFSAGHIHLAGLPEPQPQARIRTAGGTYWVDFLWERFRVIGEADGEGKYRDASEYTREKVREGHLRDEGYAIVRWTGREMFATPGSVIARIARWLRSGGYAG